MYGWVKNFVKKNLRTIFFVLVFFLSLPIEWGILQGIYLWLSPNIVINRLMAQQGLIFVQVFSFIVLWICIKRKRWFCHSLCPLGWCFHIVKWKKTRKNSIFKNIKGGEIVALFSIGLSLGGVSLLLIFDPLVILRTFFSGWILPVSICGALWSSFFLLLLILNLFLPYFWCNHICPLGGMQDLAVGLSKEPVVLFSRRNTLVLLAGWIIGYLFTDKIKIKEEKTILRPPSARKGSVFYTSCLRCGNCVDVCPTSIIQLDQSLDNFLSWQTPLLNYSKGYCLSDCVKCGQVCPGGALAPFSIKDKKYMLIGMAQLDLRACLLTQNKECDRCKSVCDYEAISIVHELLKSQIHIDNEKCVGCNACVLICPQNAIKVLAV